MLNNTILLVAVICVMTTLGLPMKRFQSSQEGSEIKQVREGDRLRLDCTAKGDRPIVSHWLHNGIPIYQSPLDMISDNILAPSLPGPAGDYSATVKSWLEIPRVTASHAGKYTCVDDTETNRKAESFTVEVIPQKSEAEPETDQLRIYQRPTKIYQTEGYPVYLTCRATQGMTKSAPLIKWSLRGQFVENDPENGIVVHSNGDLEVARVTADFHSQFSNNIACNAYGENGEVVTEHFFLYVFPA